MSPIQDVQIGTDSAYIQLDATIVSNVNGCTNWFGYFQIYNGTTEMDSFENAILATALAAKTSGKQVNIYSGACQSTGYNILHNIQLK